MSKLLTNYYHPVMSAQAWTFWVEGGIIFDWNGFLTRHLFFGPGFENYTFIKWQKWRHKSLLFVRHFITAMVRLFSSLCGNCLRHQIFCIFTANLKSYIILNLRPRKTHIYVFRKLFSFCSFWASASCT